MFNVSYMDTSGKLAAHPPGHVFLLIKFVSAIIVEGHQVTISIITILLKIFKGPRF